MAITTQGYIVKIMFANGQTLDISRNISSVGEATNYVTGFSVEEYLYTPNQNPIGVITSNTFKLNLKSKDRSLLPNNTNSIYYGYMNNTAMILLGIQYLNNEGIEKSINFGLFYVSNWTSSGTSDDKYSVVIEGVDLLGILIKNKIPANEIKRNIDIDDYLSKIQDSVNAGLNNKYKFLFNWKDTPKYNIISTSDIEADDLNMLFNIVDQSLLYNMYIDRDINTTNRVINIVDATKALGTPVASVSDDVDITYAALDNGPLVNYTGVKVNYSLYNPNAPSNIVGLSGITLTPGDNIIENIDLGGNIFKILYVGIDTEDVNLVKINSMTYNRRSCTLSIKNTSTSNITVDININGQTMLENKLSVEKSGSTDSKEILEVTNSIIPSNSVNTYATDLLNLIKRKSDTLLIKGNFDPEVFRLNNTIQCDCSRSLYISGNYKIYGLKWSLGITLKCEAKLCK